MEGRLRRLKMGAQTGTGGPVGRLKKRDAYEADVLGVRLRTLHMVRYGEDARWRNPELLEKSPARVF